MLAGFFSVHTSSCRERYHSEFYKFTVPFMTTWRWHKCYFSPKTRDFTSIRGAETLWIYSHRKPVWLVFDLIIWIMEHLFITERCYWPRETWTKTTRVKQLGLLVCRLSRFLDPLATSKCGTVYNYVCCEIMDFGSLIFL